MSNKINPLTGKEMGGEINPLTGLPIKTKSSAITPFTGTYVGAGDFSSYDKYGVGHTPWNDMQQMRAERQTELEKWKNGLAKAGITAVGATLENTVGTVLGLGDYVLSGFDDLDKSMSENPVGKLFDEVNEWSQENLPNYYTKEEQAKQGTLASLGTANFWADKFANGAAYSLGSIASMYLTGGYGAIGGAMKLTGAGAKISKSLAAYNAAKTIKAGKTLKDALGAARSGKATAMRIGKAAQMAEAGMMMSMAESAVEARETRAQTRDALIEEAKKRKLRSAIVDLNKGTQANSWEDVQLSAQELQQIELQADQAEGAAFYGNMAVLAPTNLLMFGKMVTPFKSATKSTNKIVSTTAEGGKKAFVDIAETLPKYLQKPFKAGRAAAPFVEGAITEGFQEGSQYAISQGIVSYELEKFKDSGAGDLVSSLLTAGDIRALAEASPEIGREAVKATQDPEGREQILIGALVGLLSRGRAGFQEYTTKKENTEKITKLLNNENFYNLATRAESLNQAVQIVNEMDKATQAGDKASYEILQGDLIANEILTHINHGSLDMFIERMNDAKSMEDAEFKKAFGINEETEVDKNEFVDGILNQVEEIKTANEVVNTLFPTTQTYGLPKLLMGAERRQAEQEKIRDQEIYKNTLLRTYSRLSTIDEQINSRLRNLKGEEVIDKKKRNRLQRYKRNKFGEVVVQMDGKEAVSLSTGKNLEKTVAEIEADILAQEEDGTLDPIQASIARQELNELKSLIQFRNTSALAFDNLLRNPKERDLFISREKSKAKQAENKRIFDDIVNNTDTAEELRKRREAETIPDEVSDELTKEFITRSDAESEFKRELNRLSLDDVKAKRNEDLTPQLKKVLESYIKDREDKGQVEPIIKPKPKAAKKAKEDSNKKTPKPKTPTEDSQDPPTDNPTDTPSGTTSEGDSTTASAGKRSGDPTNRRYGEVVLDENGRVVVEDNGELMDPQAEDLDASGKPIITAEGRALLRDPELLAGAELEVEIVETSWWNSDESGLAKLNELENIPMFVKYKGQYIAKLNAGNTALRTAVYENRGKKVTVELKSRQTNVTAYLRTQDGRPYYSNAFDVFGNVPIAIVAYDAETDQKVLRYGTKHVQESEESISEAIAQNEETNKLIESAPLGQVFFIYTDPNGRKRLHRAHTATLSTDEVQTALDYMKSGKTKELMDLVGTNGVPAELSKGFAPNFFRVDLEFRGEDTIYQLSLPNLLSDVGITDQYITTVSDKFLRLLSTEGITAKEIVDILYQEDKVDRFDENGKPVGKGQYYGTINNLLKVLETDPEGKTRLVVGKGEGKKVLQQRANLEKFIEGLLPAIESNLAQKKRQVDILAANSDPKYFQTLTNTPHVSNPNEFAGFAGVLTTDGTKIYGNHIVDPRLSLSDKRVKVDGKLITGEVNPPPKPPPDTTEESGTTEEGTDYTEDYFEDDDFEVRGSVKLEGKNLSGPLGDKNTGEDPDSTSRYIYLGEKGDDAPFRLSTDKDYKRMNSKEAKAWLKKRGFPTTIYDNAVNVGSAQAHGYVKNGMIYLWNNAEVGTEYHEAFHLVFRTMLNDKQREDLYNEIKNRPENKGKSTLELEEIMAEEFRDYVITSQETAKTLGGKLKKFFSDLYNYIKAIFTNDIQLTQLYSLIEANKMPKSFERNTEKFKDDSKVYRLVDHSIDEKINKDLTLTLSGHFRNEIEAYKSMARLEAETKFLTPDPGSSQRVEKEYKKLINAKVNELLGKPGTEDKGSIARYYLRNSVSLESGERVPEKYVEEIRDILDSKDDVKNKLKDVAARVKKETGENLRNLPPKGVLADSAYNNPITRENAGVMFWRTYTTWFDQVDPTTENITEFGWREAVVQELTRYEYQINSKQQKMDSSEESKDELEENKTTFDKIYNISHFESAPATKFSESVKKFFGRMVSNTPNSLGMYSPIDLDQVLRYTVAAAVGKSSVEEMVQAITESSLHLDVLKPVANHLNSNRFTAQEAAALYSYMGLDYTEFRLFEMESVQMGNKTERVFKMIQSDSKSAARQLLFDWKKESKSDLYERLEAVLKVEREKAEDGEIGAIKSIKFQNNVIDGKSRLQHIKDGYAEYNAGSTIEAKVAGINKVLWYSSIRFGSNINQASDRLLQYVTRSERSVLDQGSTPQTKIIDLNNRSRAFLKDILDITHSAGQVTSVKLKEGGVSDVFSNNDTKLRAFAEIGALFELPVATSFINSEGKTIYPYNLPTAFTRYVKEMSKAEKSELFGALDQDNFYTAYGDVDYQSLLYRIINSKNSGEKTQFEFKTFIMDAFQEKDEEFGGNTYRRMSPRDSLLVKINAFINKGLDTSFYQLPTQESRMKADFLSMPDFTNAKSMQKAGLTPLTREQIIEGIIIRDLIKIGNGHNNKAKGAVEFHLEGVDNKASDGSKLSSYAESALRDPEGEVGKIFFADVKAKAKQFLENEYQKGLKTLVNRSVEYKIITKTTKDNVTTYDIPNRTKLDSTATTRYKNAVDMLDSYYFNSLVARIEMASVLRGGATNFKNLTDFYKRMGLIGTPGNRLMVEGSFKSDPNYGMLKQYNEAYIQDFRLQDEYHDKIADRIQKLLEKQGDPDAKKKADKYRRSAKADISDAQGFISPQMKRKMEQGKGLWDQNDEVMYQNYLKGGIWVYNKSSLNEKPYQESIQNVNGKTTPNMDKNSYIVLTRDLVRGTDVLQDMYNRMMALEEYSGLQTVEVINVVSAKKGLTKQEKDAALRIDQSSDATSRFSKLTLNKQNGADLFIPQIISDKGKDSTRFNGQIRRNTISQVQDNFVYEWGKENSKGEVVDTITGKELKEMYHTSMVDMLEQQEATLLEELGYTQLQKDPSNRELHLNFLKNIRKVFFDNALKNNSLDSNSEKQLNIIYDIEKGITDFTLPMSAPMYVRKYQNLFFSLFKNNVYRMEMPGSELVQVASPGRFLLPKEGKKATKATAIRPGVVELFESNPELASISTPQQYSQYLDTIFPNSKVKDIVYHGGWVSKETGFDLNESGDGEFGKGIYFTPSKESAAEYLSISGDAPNIILAIVDLKNPVLFDDKKPRKGESKEYIKNKLAENPNNDGIIHTSKKLMNNEMGVDEKLNDEVKVNSAEQIHILGNKQDIAGFKKFVESSDTQDESTTELRELRYIDVKDDLSGLKHAEIMLSQDLLDRLGLEVGETGVSYRIPHQGYSSTIPVKVVGVLPAGYSKSIMVPGNIVVQTGSDFDIDKLFSMFRDKSGTKLAQSRNSIIDILETVTLSANHAADTFAPLEQEDLDKEAEKYGGATTLPFSHPFSDIEIEEQAKAAATQVGAYANGLAGLSVLSHGRASGIPGQTGVLIHPNRVMNIDGYELNMISQTSKITGKNISSGMSQRLSAALDAFKKLIHSALNDNSDTVATISFLESIGMTEESIVAFMNMPLVKDFVKDRRLNSYMRNDARSFKALGISDIKKIQNNTTSPPAAMTTEEILEIIRTRDRDSDKAKAFFRNFAHAYYSGKELREVYDIVTVDRADGVGDLAEIEVIASTLDSYKRKDANGRSLIPYSYIEDFVEGDAYPLAKQFYKMIYKSMEVSSKIFLGGAESTQAFKQTFLDLTQKESLTSKEHRTLDRALFYYMLTKEGSPLGKLLTTKAADMLLLNRDNNIYTRIKKLMEEVPTLRENLLLNRIKEGNGYNAENQDVFTIIQDNIEKLSPMEREVQRAHFMDLLYYPEKYTSNPKLQSRIQKIGGALVFNAIVTTGLSPTYGSYYDAIPIEFFTDIEDNGVTLGEFLREETKKAQENPRYFEDAIIPVIRNYGTRNVDNGTLIPTITTPVGDRNIAEGPMFIATRNPNRERDSIQIKYKANGSYKTLQHMSIGGKIIEMNLRDSTGKIIESSMFTNERGTTNVRRPGVTTLVGVNQDIRNQLTSSIEAVKAKREQFRECK